jgi:hypothetical protein
MGKNLREFRAPRRHSIQALALFKTLAILPQN